VQLDDHEIKMLLVAIRQVQHTFALLFSTCGVIHSEYTLLSASHGGVSGVSTQAGTHFCSTHGSVTGVLEGSVG
jgi:hypothetical protein